MISKFTVAFLFGASLFLAGQAKSQSPSEYSTDCKQLGGPLQCIKTPFANSTGVPKFTIGVPSNPYDQYGEGATPELAVDNWIARVNAYRLANPSGQWTIPAGTLLYAKDLDRPSVCGGPFLSGTLFVTTCWVHLELNLNGLYWAPSGSLTASADTNCPAGWRARGSFAPNFSGLPGYCSTDIPVKQFPPDDPCCGAPPKTVGNPIEVSIYNKIQDETDYASARNPTPLVIRRIYNSRGTMSRVNMGVSWRFFYDRFLLEDSTGYVSVMRQSGRIYDFKLVGGNYVTDADVTLTLTKTIQAGGQTQWNLKTAIDGTEIYDGAGRLTSTADRYGNTTTLTYDANGRLSTVVDPFGQSLQLTYNAANRVSNITLSNGDIYAYSYDTSGNLTSVLYPDQRVRTYVYGELTHTSSVSRPNALTGIVDERGIRLSTFKYDSSYRAYQTYRNPDVGSYFLTFGGANTTFVGEPAGGTRLYTFVAAPYQSRLLQSMTDQCFSPNCASEARTTYTYDGNNNRSSVTDFRNNRTCYAYDLTRNLETTRIEGLASTTACPTALAAATLAAPARRITTTWHPTFRLPATITEAVAGGTKTTTNTYDANGNLTQRQLTTPAGSRNWSWTYDSFGRVLTATDSLGRTSVNTYYPNTAAQNTSIANSRGMLASTTNAAGHTTTISAYNAYGQPLSMTDANGLVTNMTYDVRQRLTSRSVAGETTTYEYDPVGQLRKVTTPDGSTLQYTYDAAQRLTQIQDGLGNKTVYTLDYAGNRIKEDALDPLGALARTRSRVYDGLNRLQKDIGGLGATQTTTYAYDANNNQTGMTDPLNRVTTNLYDALNRLIQVNDPLNGAAAPTKYEYDAQDNLTKVTDPKNLATTYTYNGFNELVTQVSPDTGSTSFTYDAAGNMLTKTDARGVTVTYSYDVLNRVTSINYPATTSATGNSPAQTVSYVYDSCGNGKGRLCSFTDRTGSTTYAYNIYGRITSKSQTVNGLTQSVGYRYNSAGQMDQMTLPSGKKVAVSYANNRITSLTVDGQPIVKSADYEPFGPIGEWTWGNDSVASPNKHTRYFDLDGRNTKIESGNVIDPAIIVYDAASRITALQRLTSNTVDPTKSASFGYDNLDRLTTVTPGAGSAASAQSYGYDPIGNRLTNNINGSLTNYSYGTTSHRLNALTGSTSKTFGYDAAGNRLTDGIQSWIYGGDGRPSAISLTGTNPVSIQAGINALGQRVLKTVNSGSSGSTTRFVYDEAGRLIGEYDIDGKPIQETIWLNDLPVAVLK
jgi:YD repeat-containing protein